MARERWFFAPTHKRQGPMPLPQLVDGLLRLPDPRSCLVWKNGLPAWTPAGEVAEVDQHLAPFVVPRKPTVAPAPAGPAVSRESQAAARTRQAARTEAQGGPSSLVYVGGGAGVLVLGIVVWLFWPKAPEPRPKTGPTPEPGLLTATEGVRPPGPGATAAPGGPPGQTGFAGWSDQESELPRSEIAKLKAVAAWTGTHLEITVYNGGVWRVTELVVQPRRLVKDTFVDDERQVILLPVGAQVDKKVGQVMDRMPGTRSKPGVSPLDTGTFSGTAGERPEAFGTTIVSARGYPPK